MAALGPITLELEWVAQQSAETSQIILVVAGHATPVEGRQAGMVLSRILAPEEPMAVAQGACTVAVVVVMDILADLVVVVLSLSGIANEENGHEQISTLRNWIRGW